MPEYAAAEWCLRTTVFLKQPHLVAPIFRVTSAAILNWTYGCSSLLEKTFSIITFKISASRDLQFSRTEILTAVTIRAAGDLVAPRTLTPKLIKSNVWK